MSEKSVSWNLWHGCHKLSDGCKHCYVYRRDESCGKDASIVTKTQNFMLPVAKKRDGSYKVPSGSWIWTCFTSDFLLQDADNWRDEAWDMIRQRFDCNFFFVTKRIDRLDRCLPSDWGAGYNNVHICCTVENQKMTDYRLPIFRDLPVVHKYIASEPLLTPIDMSQYLGGWLKKVTVGGESGFNARICKYEWVLDIRRQCALADVPFYFKQTGALFEKDGRIFRVPRKLQHSQARKAGINTSPRLAP